MAAPKTVAACGDYEYDPAYQYCSNKHTGDVSNCLFPNNEPKCSLANYIHGLEEANTSSQKWVAADQMAWQNNGNDWKMVAIITIPILVAIFVIATIEICCVKRRLNKMTINWIHVSWLLNICKNNRRGNDKTSKTEDGESLLLNGSTLNNGTRGPITMQPHHAEEGLTGSPPASPPVASAPPADNQPEPENRNITSNEGNHNDSEDEHLNIMPGNRELTREMTANTPQDSTEAGRTIAPDAYRGHGSEFCPNNTSGVSPMLTEQPTP